jgi:hypothetical protein
MEVQPHLILATGGTGNTPRARTPATVIWRIWQARSPDRMRGVTSGLSLTGAPTQPHAPLGAGRRRCIIAVLMSQRRRGVNLEVPCRTPVMTARRVGHPDRIPNEPESAWNCVSGWSGQHVMARAHLPRRAATARVPNENAASLFSCPQIVCCARWEAAPGWQSEGWITGTRADSSRPIGVPPGRSRALEPSGGAGAWRGGEDPGPQGKERSA